MLCAQVTDDFILSGKMEDLTWFEIPIRKRFKVGKTILSGNMNFNGALLEHDANGDITPFYRSINGSR